MCSLRCSTLLHVRTDTVDVAVVTDTTANNTTTTIFTRVYVRGVELILEILGLL